MDNQNEFENGDEVFFRISIEEEENGTIIIKDGISEGIKMDKRIANRIIEKDSKKTMGGFCSIELFGIFGSSISCDDFAIVSTFFGSAIVRLKNVRKAI